MYIPYNNNELPSLYLLWFVVVVVVIARSGDTFKNAKNELDN